MPIEDLSDEELMNIAQSVDISSASDEELMKIAGIKPKQELDTSQFQAMAAAGLKVVPFGQDIVSVPLAAIGSLKHDIPFSEARPAVKEYLEQEYQLGKEQYPYASGASALQSGLSVGMALPFDKALKGGKLLSKTIKSGVLGGLTGLVYGAGEGTGDERIRSGIEQGVYGLGFGAVAPAAISGVSTVAKGIYKGTKPLAQRAARLFPNRGKQPEVRININGQGQPSSVGYRQAAEDIIPLSEGQRTQNQKLLSLEQGALRGGYGDDATEAALRARAIQEQKAVDILRGMGNETSSIEPAVQTGEMLAQARKAAKLRTNQAYKKVAQMSANNPLKFTGQYFDEAIKPELDDFIKNGYDGTGFDLNSPNMTNAKRLVEQYNKFKKLEGVTAVDFQKLENYRGRLSQGMREAQVGSPEKAFLSGLLQRLDDSVEAMPKEAIISGDDKIVDAFINARAARSKQGKLFERQEFVKKILNDEETSATELTKILFNNSKSLNQKPAKAIKQILAATDDGAKPILKVGVIGDLYEKSMTKELTDGREMLDFGKMSGQLDLLLKKRRGVAELLLSPDEIQTLERLREASGKIASYKPGTINYSNTAYELMNLIGKFSPSAKAFADKFGGKGAAESIAEQDLIENLTSILKNDIDDLTRRKFKAAEVLGNKAIIAITGNEPPRKAASELMITVNPRKE